MSLNCLLLTGVIYYTLGNIRSLKKIYRSQLDAIQLLVIATSPVIKKYGIDEILEPFLEGPDNLRASEPCEACKPCEACEPSENINF